MRVSRLGPEAVPDIVVPEDWYLAAVLVLAVACLGLILGCALHNRVGRNNARE